MFVCSTTIKLDGSSSYVRTAIYCNGIADHAYMKYYTNTAQH